jgi:hypothetical protein
MAQEWNIRARGHACHVCQQKFADRQPCVSALRAADGTFDRLDYCQPCWQGAARDWEPFSLWEGAYEAPVVVVKDEPVKKDTAETLLRRLVALEDPAMQNVVYVLAVMLERGKQLVERDAKPHESGGILRIYEHRKTGDSFVVLDPRLRLDQIGDVQNQVVALLSGTGHLQASDAPSEIACPPPST